MQRITSREFSLLPESTLKLLFQNHITTVVEFIQEDALKLSTIAKIPLSQILEIRNEILAKYSSQMLCGSTLLDQNEFVRKFVETGIESLDSVIGGGIPTRCITEICGLADSGKTQLALQIATNLVKDTVNAVLYIDTKGDFSAVRIQKILEANQCSHKEMAVSMHRIFVVHIWSMEELVELFQNLRTKSYIVENLALIIVDSLPCLMFQHLGEGSKIGLKFLNIFVNHSRYLCKESNLSMICINLQTRWIDLDNADIDDEGETTSKDTNYIERKNRCLGKYWQHIPSLVLLTEKFIENNPTVNVNIKITVSQSTINYNMEGNRECFLKVNEFGVT